MFFHTKERLALLFFALVLWLGLLLDVLWTRYPQWRAGWRQRTGGFYLKTDVNRANAVELEQVPYIGAYTAQKILDYREQNGCIADILQLKTLSGIRPKNYAVFSNYLFVREGACEP
jgi:hypothetical protein